MRVTLSALIGAGGNCHEHIDEKRKSVIFAISCGHNVFGINNCQPCPAAEQRAFFVSRTRTRIGLIGHS